MALGLLHPDKLLRELSSKQIAEWAAYSELEPFGERNRDWYFGRIIEVLAKMFGGKDFQKCSAQDFMGNSRLDFERSIRKSKKRMSGKTIKEFFKMVAGKEE